MKIPNFSRWYKAVLMVFYAPLLLSLGLAIPSPSLAAADVQFSWQDRQVTTTQFSSNPPLPLRDPEIQGLPFVLSADSKGITLRLITPDYSLDTISFDGQECQLLGVPGYPELGQAGWPRLPVQGAQVGVPAESPLALTVLEADPILVAGRFDLCPVSEPIIEFQPSGEISLLGETNQADAQVYGQSEFFPAQPAELASVAFLRDLRVAQVAFHPFQYNPVTGEILIYRQISVHLQFDADSNSGALAHAEEGDFADLLRRSLVNYDQAKNWRQSPPATLARLSALDTAWGAETYKLEIAAQGMYQVSYNDLLTAGANLNGMDPRTIQVFNRGVELAIRVNGEQDGAFNPGDRVLFYGEAPQGRYSPANIYWLTWGVAEGKRMPTASGAPNGASISPSFLHTRRFESNLLYLSSFADSSGDVWYWELINAQSGPVSKEYSISVDQLAAISENARLKTRLKSYSATPSHHTRLYLNNQLILDSTWSANSELNVDVTFPMQYLIAGENILRMECPRDQGITLDRVLVNWFELSYWRTYRAADERLDFSSPSTGSLRYQIEGFSSSAIDLFDIQNPASPIRLSEALVQAGSGSYRVIFGAAQPELRRYLAISPAGYQSPARIERETSSNLKSAQNAADYLLITHAQFSTEAQQLAEWRTRQGLRVARINVQDIYDEFNHGLVDPQAIRDFIQYAYLNWQKPAPQYVLLLGDGHYDPLNYKGNSEPSFIPPFLVDFDLYLRETASDNRYVTISGEDNLPDLMIGRLPARSRQEAAAMVAKIIAYEQIPSSAGWNSQILFVADNPDAAGNFPNYSDRIADTLLPSGYSAQKVYYGSTHTTSASAQAAVRQGIDQGKLLVNYVGHGAMTQWASENMLSNASISAFMNDGKMPVFASFACLTGYFHTPNSVGDENSALAETLVRPANRGAIAAWSSTGMGLASGQDFLNRGLYQALFFDGQARLGAAVLQAKFFLAGSSSSYPDLIDAYTLFGDPALKMNVLPSDLVIDFDPPADEVIYAGLPFTYTLTYSNQGAALATRVMIENPLPESVTEAVVISLSPGLNPVAGNNLAWELDQLPPGASGSITIQGRVDALTPSELLTEASISTPIADANIENNRFGPLPVPVLDPSMVLIQGFTASYTQGQIEISWQTNQELHLDGFNLYRAVQPGICTGRLNAQMIPSQNPGIFMGAKYRYLDQAVEIGQTYQYCLEIFSSSQPILVSGPSVSTLSYLFLPLTMR